MSKQLNLPVIVISGINLFEGGGLSVFKDCLKSLNNSYIKSNYTIIALVHKISIFEGAEFEHIILEEFPKSRTSYLYRLYYEYYFFKGYAKRRKAFFWLSMHDMTPTLRGVKQAVYCHNPSPFNKIRFKDIYLQPTQVLFKLFYKFLYQINIHKNKYVIVQQLWIKENFIRLFNINKEKIIVALPQISTIPQVEDVVIKQNDREKIFFFPTFPRPFKNIEVICEAVKILRTNVSDPFKIILTIDGSENRYASLIVNNYKHIQELDFVGLLPRNEVYKVYSECDYLIFPSKLETWGLPLTEFKEFNKGMLVANLPYAKETVGAYNKVKFFDPDDALQLSTFMQLIMSEKLDFDNTSSIQYPDPVVYNWEDLFLHLIAT